MNVKKRPRLELATAATATATDVALLSNSVYGNVANIVGGGTTSGLFLTTSSSGGSGSSSMGGVTDINNGAQIYLTICGDDDNSNESQEFYAIESIKQEPDLDALHALLPTNLQLPTGCEIYLVKDTKTSEQMLQMKHTIPTTTATTNTTAMASIKLEPDSIPSTSVLFVSGGGAATPTTHNVVVAANKDSTPPNNGNGSISSIAVANHPHPPTLPAHASQTAAVPSHFNVKLDAYKKRDDKRRATHNEVERRRRDKINCWIFKLKEMLPTEGNRYKPQITTNANLSAETVDGSNKTTMTTTTSTSLRSSHNNGRTPPNDSKSQILIKACDYIKSMQNEIDNLRDCLQEAESLRLSNQALRDELDNLKQQQELQELRFNTAGGSFNVTLNSLNSSATSDLFDGIDTAPHLSTISSINFTKRGLMITDYDE
ncbi:uncharacterized protein LOC6565636 [Drosophila grimshawi]|uniref:GH24300 n=1 Tax=Drosophila grimshawi TaxID=7222 RepID=B4JMM3_DROGR|nr:uncharacterized protein LOC6565636 [Drosophila grimshawi]EDV91966.1 GH24300 [Drosophila grimshawi]